MKIRRILLVAFIGVCLHFPSFSQIDPMFGATSEFTIAGTLVGGYAGAKFSDRIGVGIMYETRTRQFDSRFNENLNLAGLFMSYKVLEEGKIDLEVFLRGGYANERFLIVAPALNFSYYASPKLNIFCMPGIRSEKPSLAFGLFYRLKGKSD